MARLSHAATVISVYPNFSLVRAAFAFGVMASVAACSGGDSSCDTGTPVQGCALLPSVDDGSSAPPVSSNNNNNVGTSVSSIDITNLIFSTRSDDCGDYVNRYFANVVDEQRSAGFDAALEITAGSTTCLLTSDNIPNHNFNDASANFATDVSEVNQTFTISRTPEFSGSDTPRTLARYDAVMLNGVPVDLLSAGCYDPTSPQADGNGNVAVGCDGSAQWSMEPLGTVGGFGVDQHNAHVQPDGSYHYHGDPVAMFDDFPGPSGSPVIGFAADGYPIFGSYFMDGNSGQVRKVVSGYSLKTGLRGTRDNTNPGGNHDGSYVQDWEYISGGDLDECNGMTLNGVYGYYVTEGYPYVLGCFKGTPDPSFTR